LRNMQITKWIFLLLLMGLMGCATGRSADPTPEGQPSQVVIPSVARQSDPARPSDSTSSEAQPAKEPIRSAPPATMALQDFAPTQEDPTAESPEGDDAADDAVPTEQVEKSEQEGLDSALELCQISNEYWEKGDLDNALSALDDAYGLILKVSPNQDPDLLQQKEDLRFTISKRIIEYYSARFKVANGFHSEIPVVMNRHVEEALQMFKGPLKDFFTEAYQRSGRYRPAIVEALKEAGLPEELSWLPFIESGFKVRALSRARALGLWQFIASTGYKYGLKRDKWIDERMDPAKSTRAAIAYLKELHQIFGDWTTALAAYNCGEGTVLRCIQTQRVNYLDNFWDLYQKLPRETAFYVPQFQAVLHIINNPERYGFILPPVEEPMAYEEVMVEKQVHMEGVAKILGVPDTVLKDLNAELRHHATPDRRHALKVPAGKGPTLLAQLEEIPAWSPPTPIYEVHQVRKGETLPVLASRYGASVNEIMAANGFKRGKRLSVGAKVKIPILEPAGYRNQARRPGAPEISAKPAGQYATHVVKPGDTLSKIARQFNTTINVLRSVNSLGGEALRIGQALKVPVATPAPKTVNRMSSPVRYTVQKGDSPLFIAQKHQMDVSDLLNINRLTPQSVIFPGQVLLLKTE
jgi:membrane-bound lytic murein transglycosylase D